jgi:FkbM family methyltransferase
MKQALKVLVRSFLRKCDIGVTRYSTLQRLCENANASREIQLLLALPNNHASQLLKNLRKSRSEYGQDLLVLSQLDFKRSGYFVEFGATNGVDISNTYLLESEFGWNGILAEPARCWHEALGRNRRAHIETRCVWKESNRVLTFNETDVAELSTIGAFSSRDFNKNTRKSGKSYEVETISLNDLLSKYNAPRQIDYLSLDTEGSEVEILSGFDFGKHEFRVITCEHNYTSMRDKLFALLTSKGYVRYFQELSNCDDWYIKSS